MFRLLELIAQHTRLVRGFGALMVAAVCLFVADNVFVYGTSWPGIGQLLAHAGVFAPPRNFQPLEGMALAGGWLQAIGFAAVLALVIGFTVRTPQRGYAADVRVYDRISAYIIRAAFWAVLLVGIVDSMISFLRVEGFLPVIFGEHLATQLGRSAFRGLYVHYPLIALGAIIAVYVRSLGFIWLALMIVLGELTIVISRFVFSYEQTFQGDVVRFWYAGLFLFASAYTLVHDGHVRVDVFYANFTERGKAMSNSLGVLLLGLPLCWTILVLGTATKASMIISPLLSFEIAQAGFGMYTKYLMAAYLVVFSVSMAIQFVSFFLTNMAKFQNA